MLYENETGMVSNVATIEENHDMRDRLLANLRSQARQSRVERQSQIQSGCKQSRDDVQANLNVATNNTVNFSVAATEPQSVLIKNRNEHLRKEVLRLRSRYANLLTEESDN